MDHPACRAYITRATARPAFIKAHADQMAHFAAADKAEDAEIIEDAETVEEAKK